MRPSVMGCSAARSSSEIETAAVPTSQHECVIMTTIAPSHSPLAADRRAEKRTAILDVHRSCLLSRLSNPKARDETCARRSRNAKGASRAHGREQRETGIAVMLLALQGDHRRLESQRRTPAQRA